eukprot:4417444-Pyramimonas_sp.AAC.4
MLTMLRQHRLTNISWYFCVFPAQELIVHIMCTISCDYRPVLAAAPVHFCPLATAPPLLGTIVVQSDCNAI